MRARYAFVALAALSLVLSAAALLGAVRYTNMAQASERQQAQAQQAARQRQSAAFERKLCTTLGRLAALEPPAGEPSGNPSRGYEQALHEVLAQLGPDVGCP